MAPPGPPRPHPLRAFSHPAYRAIWIGALISNVGTWMETIAVGVHVTETTGQAGWTGTVAALVFLPATVIAPLGGALADRFERRRFLSLVTWIQTVLAAALLGLVLTDRLSLAAVSVLMFLTGCASTLGGPAFNALLADVVPKEDLLSAMTLSSAQFNLARVIGPALAAPAVAYGGLKVAFGINALSFVAVLIALDRARPPPRPALPREPLWAGIRSGLRAARQDGGIRSALALTLATSVLISPFVGLVPAFAIKQLGHGAGGTSALVTAQGVGAVLAAVASAGLADRFGRRRVLQLSTIAIPGIAGLYWLSPNLGFAIAGIFFLGANYLFVITGCSTVCLSRAPRALQARMASLFSVVLGGGYALGLMVIGWAGDLYGLGTMGLAASAGFAVILVVLHVKRPRLFQAVDDPLPALPEGAAMSSLPHPGPAELELERTTL